jgi:DNA-binding transcriptional ArsR family regulator
MKASQGKRAHDRQREMTPALIYALNHPVRRQVLRKLNEQGGEASPSELSRSISVGLSALGFHARVLCELGATRSTRTQQVRGSLEHFYASNVSGNELVTAVLLETQADDRTASR